jgi:hypothetical protein
LFFHGEWKFYCRNSFHNHPPAPIPETSQDKLLLTKNELEKEIKELNHDSYDPLQTFVISPKEKTTVWVKQNVNFFQQNGSVIKIEQN